MFILLSKIIVSLKVKKSAGIDGISANMFFREVIAVPIAHPVNIPLGQATVPGIMGITKVLAVYKNKELNLVNNFYLLCMSKILEKVRYKRICTS